jgi:hypothetical protein
MHLPSSFPSHVRTASPRPAIDKGDFILGNANDRPILPVEPECSTTGISTLAHLLPHVTLRRFCSAGLRPGSTSAPVLSTPCSPC